MGRYMLSLTVSISVVVLLGRAQVSAQEIPHLDRSQGATQLIVDGQPFLVSAANWAIPRQERQRRRMKSFRGWLALTSTPY